MHSTPANMIVVNIPGVKGGIGSKMLHSEHMSSSSITKDIMKHENQQNTGILFGNAYYVLVCIDYSFAELYNHPLMFNTTD